MRARFEVDEELNTVYFELEGTPGAGEFQAFACALADGGIVEPGMHVVIDARSLRGYPSEGELARLAPLYRSLWVTGAIGRTAVVVQRDGHRAARAFQIYSGDGDPRLEVFRNADDAFRWLTNGRFPVQEPLRALA